MFGVAYGQLKGNSVLLHMTLVLGMFSMAMIEVQESMPSHISTFQAFDCITTVKISFTKASCMVNLRAKQWRNPP